MKDRNVALEADKNTSIGNKHQLMVNLSYISVSYDQVIFLLYSELVRVTTVTMQDMFIYLKCNWSSLLMAPFFLLQIKEK